MNILVTNDDGINAPGIRSLVSALSERADVYVCAPDGQRSGNSQSITLNKRIFVEEREVPGAKKAYAATGTPADCAKMGIQLCEDQGIKIHMVYAGINMGSNLGKDTLYSGTVGAAKEAAVSGYQSVAVSVDSHEATEFEAANILAVKMIDIVYGKFPSSVIMNINAPNLPKDQIKGVKITKLGDRYYSDRFVPVDDEEGGYQLGGAPGNFEDFGDEYDVTANHHNYASITPLHFDYTDHNNFKEIEKWELTI